MFEVCEVSTCVCVFVCMCVCFCVCVCVCVCVCLFVSGRTHYWDSFRSLLTSSERERGPSHTHTHTHNMHTYTHTLLNSQTHTTTRSNTYVTRSHLPTSIHTHTHTQICSCTTTVGHKHKCTQSQVHSTDLFTHTQTRSAPFLIPGPPALPPRLSGRLSPCPSAPFTNNLEWVRVYCHTAGAPSGPGNSGVHDRERDASTKAHVLSPPLHQHHPTHSQDSAGGAEIVLHSGVGEHESLTLAILGTMGRLRCIKAPSMSRQALSNGHRRGP